MDAMQNHQNSPCIPYNHCHASKTGKLHTHGALHTLQQCRFESELRDSSKHDSWQREAVAADLAARAAAVRKRRDEMAATQEAAVQARHQLVQDNLQAGHQIKVTPIPLLPVSFPSFLIFFASRLLCPLTPC